MAASPVTTTSVVQVTVYDSQGYTKTFNLDNPKSNLTLNQVKSAFQIPIAGGWLYSNSGYPITSVKSANYSEAIKTEIEGEVVEVTPATLEYDGLTQNSITVTGGSVTSTNIINLNYEVTKNGSSFVFTSPVISEDGTKVTLGNRTFINGGGECTFTGTATLEIFIGSEKLTVPIVINVTENQM